MSDDAQELHGSAPRPVEQARGDAHRVSGVRSLDRSVAILNAFSDDRPRMSLSEIADRLGLNTSTTHRLLQALKVHGLVTQPDGGKAYALGPAVLRLARLATGSLDVQEIARPHMRRLRDEIGETVGLHVLRSDLVRVVVDQVESHQALRRSYTELGEPIPLHQGAPGKVLLAWLPDEQRSMLLTAPLEAATDGTVTDPDRIRQEIVTIRERGYALSFGERVDGIHTVAVALRDHAGHAFAAISVTGPAMRMPRERLDAIAPIVADAAGRISSAFGPPAVKEEAP